MLPKIYKKYIHLYKKFKCSYPIRSNSGIAGHHRLSRQSFCTRNGWPLWSCWPVRYIDSQTWWAIGCSVLPSRTWWENPIAIITKHLNHRTWRTQAGIHWGTSSLLTNFSCSGRCYGWGQKQSLSYLDVNLGSYNNDPFREICPLVAQLSWS